MSGPLVMGIVNASPESFSDGGRWATLDAQVERALELVADGADLIDVGGESGVTGIPAIAVDEEVRRVVPLVERLVAEGVVVSVDTWKPAVARASLAAGAALINDVSGLRDPELADACAEAGAGLVVMHTRAEPKVKQFPHYDDVVADVVGFVRERVAVALERGVEAKRIMVDPGPDFAKTPAETVAVLRSLDALAELGYPILLAVSRKDFVGALTDRPPRDRGAGTLAAIGAGVDAGAAMVRVHDVAATVDFLKVRAALIGETSVDPALRLPDELRRQRAA
ncbi:MAG: dihydropteroate synthase [Thermoleophilaceae bacterium]|nr:dihydropteroate synthase [Thermoleophilaceae bacterium]